jgi:hypothetical protein
MQPHAFGSEFEGLEDRLLLAGNITSVLAGGVLTLTGDDVANQVQLTVGTNGQMVARGLTGTTINGMAAVNFGVVNTLTVLGGLGDDKIELNHSGRTITNDVILDGGAGNDTISATGKFGADLNLLGGLGNDKLSVKNARVLTAGSTATDVTMNGGEGNDALSITASTIGNDVILQTGLGIDTVTASGLAITDDLSLTEDLNLIDTNGVNTYLISNVNTRDDIQADLRGGNDTLTITNVKATLGRIELDLGDGNNQLTLTKAKAFGNTVGTLLVPGDGILVTSGAGVDKIGINESETAGQIVIDVGDGTNRVELIRVSTTTRLGTLDITTGAGQDSVTLDKIRIGGASVIDTGDSSDIFTLRNSELVGTLLASLNTGDDFAYVGNNRFASVISYDINGGIGGNTAGFDVLREGVNYPVSPIVFLNFEVILPL